MFKVGDQRYYLPGYRGSGLLAILCTVIEVDDHFRQQHPDGEIFYWVDEPVGHGLAQDELLTQDVAIETLMARYDDACEEARNVGEDASNLANAQLLVYRKEAQEFISSTWKGEHSGFKPLPDKKEWNEWINPQMVFEKRQQPLKGSAIFLNGKIYSVLAPGRHCHVIRKIIAENPEIPTPMCGNEGFITQDNRFVDRVEGAKIALETWQIHHLNWPPQLYSEDLW